MKRTYPNGYSAEDIMSREVVTVSVEDTLRDVMRILVENHVSGAPVVDPDGRCIGLVSASDILSFEEDHSETIGDANEDVAQFFDQETQRWENVRLSAFALEELADISVESVMSTEPICVELQTPITDVAKIMVERRIHRVMVVDAHGNLRGIVTAMDFVSALVKS